MGELLETLEFKPDFLKKPVSSYSKGMRQRHKNCCPFFALLLDNPAKQHRARGVKAAGGFVQEQSGIPFAHDEIVSIHSQEPTLEDMFIQYTGRGLS